MLNMQMDRRVVIDTNAKQWEPSPMPGVWRKPLAREEAERGHATSIVRYDPDSEFSRHEHPLGEEIFVLEGTFSDEHGDFEPGAYFRNPPGSGHAPYSKKGCVLLVKLHQFLPDDMHKVCIDTFNANWMRAAGGGRILPLHSFGPERVALFECSADKSFQFSNLLTDQQGGFEVYVVSGAFADEFGVYRAGTWLRSPDQINNIPTLEHDTVIWMKTGHITL